MRHEQRNREVYSPPISLYRWWARRPHALIGSLIDAAREDREALVVADPFSGGGTVALEAARRGLPVYAQDIHPWAVTGLATALDGIDVDELADAAATLLSSLEPLRQQLYGTPCPTHGVNSELAHVFWVRVTRCPSCEETIHLFPYSLLTVASRATTESTAYFGCRACGTVSLQPILGGRRRRCPHCTFVLDDPNTSLLPARAAQCVRPGCGEKFPAFSTMPPEWKAILVQRSCRCEGRAVLHFDLPRDADLTSEPEVASLPAAVRRSIPAGVETTVLRRAGFRRWCDLYPRRQLSTLVVSAATARQLDASAAAKKNSYSLFVAPLRWLVLSVVGTATTRRRSRQSRIIGLRRWA